MNGRETIRKTGNLMIAGIVRIVSISLVNDGTNFFAIERFLESADIPQVEHMDG